ncbi:MAG TPA: hypothetical protein VGB16_01245 [candidate division Zixibacteria bacterium]
MKAVKFQSTYGSVTLACLLLLVMALTSSGQEGFKLVIPRFDKGTFVSSDQYVLDRFMEILAAGSKTEIVGPELAKYELEKQRTELGFRFSTGGYAGGGQGIRGRFGFMGRDG